MNEGPPKSSFPKGGFRKNVNIVPKWECAVAFPSSSLGFSSKKDNLAVVFFILI